jgi:hypothetical protein
MEFVEVLRCRQIIDVVENLNALNFDLVETLTGAALTVSQVSIPGKFILVVASDGLYLPAMLSGAEGIGWAWLSIKTGLSSKLASAMFCQASSLAGQVSVAAASFWDAGVSPRSAHPNPRINSRPG